MTDNDLVVLMLELSQELVKRAEASSPKAKQKKAKAVKATKSKGGKAWILGKTRGRVPQFVLDTTKAKNKQELSICYAQGSKFVEGEPLPRQLE